MLFACFCAWWTTPEIASAGDATGDAFDATLTLEGSAQISSASGVVGAGALDLCAAAGASCDPTATYEVDWLSGDRVQFDWFDSSSPDPTRVTLDLDDLDFTGFAGAERVVGVTQQPSAFPPAEKLAIFFDPRSIRLDYLGLEAGEAADGDVGVFDVKTDDFVVDAYAAEVAADAAPAGALNGERGDTSPQNIGADYTITWVDADSFELDWFTSNVTDVVITITGLDFANQGGFPGEITSVTKQPSAFPNDPSVGFGPDSITISYLGLAPGESEDGDLRVFDIATSVPDDDFYTITLIEDGAEISKTTSVRGIDFNVDADYLIDWVDGDTFEVDWFAFAVTDGRWEIAGLDFQNASGQPLVITGVTKGGSTFCVDPSVSFTESSVTLDYTGMPPGESECGDVRAFDLTLPEPGGAVPLLLGAALLLAAQRGRRHPLPRAPR